MKKLLIIFIAVLILTSCRTNVKYKQTDYSMFGRKLYIIEIDSCEYLMSYNDISTLTHKGNCKFCAERHRKELEKMFLKELIIKDSVTYSLK